MVQEPEKFFALMQGFIRAFDTADRFNREQVPVATSRAREREWGSSE